jgi:hypothetical protein
MTWPFRGTGCRLRKAMVPLFVFAVMGCASLPASASAELAIRVTVHNNTDRVLTFEVAKLEFVRSHPSKWIRIRSKEQSFTVSKGADAVAPVQETSIWVAVKCPVGVTFGLEFYNSGVGYPAVRKIDDHGAVELSTEHVFGTQNHYDYWGQHVQVYRHDDSGNRKVFSETVYQAPSCA